MKLTRGLLTYQLHLPSNQQSLGSLHDLVWATTFSDLVTLLFCFFLTMVSLGPIGQAVKQNQAPPKPIEVPAQDGIGFAMKGDGVEKRVFLLRTEELTQLTRGDVPDTLNEIKRVAFLDGYQNRKIRITISPALGSAEIGSKWLSIIQRLTELQRQLFDGRGQTMLVLRIARIEVASADQEPIAGMVEIEEVSSPNG